KVQDCKYAVGATRGRHLFLKLCSCASNVRRIAECDTSAILWTRTRPPARPLLCPTAAPMQPSTTSNVLLEGLTGRTTMSDFTVGYFVGSLSSTSINRKLAQALVKLAPEGLTMREIPIRDLSLYSQ